MFVQMRVLNRLSVRICCRRTHSVFHNIIGRLLVWWPIVGTQHTTRQAGRQVKIYIDKCEPPTTNKCVAQLWRCVWHVSRVANASARQSSADSVSVLWVALLFRPFDASER